MIKTNAVEIRNIMGRLVAKWYPEEGVIEIIIKGCRLQLIIPPRTQIRINRGEAPAKKQALTKVKILQIRETAILNLSEF